MIKITMLTAARPTTAELEVSGDQLRHQGQWANQQGLELTGAEQGRDGVELTEHDIGERKAQVRQREHQGGLRKVQAAEDRDIVQDDVDLGELHDSDCRRGQRQEDEACPIGQLAPNP